MDILSNVSCEESIPLMSAACFLQTQHLLGLGKTLLGLHNYMSHLFKHRVKAKRKIVHANTLRFLSPFQTYCTLNTGPGTHYGLLLWIFSAVVFMFRRRVCVFAVPTGEGRSEASRQPNSSIQRGWVNLCVWLNVQDLVEASNMPYQIFPFYSLKPNKGIVISSINLYVFHKKLHGPPQSVC